ncbi:GNAT family N-acetyltransferase [Nitrogeniibacter aestuarii]|uniref:GNAT family N-acetyltransferase n=1 Tax=Nitrogeniibacter aestuarii TaxID=2815343 RepID=UPI001D107B1C|nr:GNAT family N-acetyltransferase [Nitrogeniibacter aestuarii]
MIESVSLMPCDAHVHLDAVTEILNDAIVNSTALYDYAPRSRERMLAWFDTKQAADHPVIAAVDARGTLLGFATYGPFRAFPAYKYTVEHSVYVHRDHRGRGLGRQLLGAIVDAAEAAGLHAMVGAVDADNTDSIALHESMGFVRVGALPQVGFKFGRWLDLVLLQRILAGPADPMDG